MSSLIDQLGERLEHLSGKEGVSVRTGCYAVVTNNPDILVAYNKGLFLTHITYVLWVTWSLGILSTQDDREVTNLSVV